ncbi:helix-turn-helix domain-containing protein [Marinomonas mediterranea]|jgi:Helix-turn-helix.|uniref:Helix-turn-helix domain protein n=1 Tax=Marinomonas mediterranea (strain ATCC 700492 / JCM 21426 / NBRC 103028 / MMB-1) TaxID=717774 RepID=F2JVF9_MARM1|nr:helix-turn-helix domain-containing protein [Marinomonas mediterranea]ADZ89417.1 helix-turn-helix domain protein [Marinomonas mediterranea MMB-1]WCN07511.1 helix-turn-helix domain-containing protein [Marinomonas mediterranea]WCN11611.1 helix-turn-helix domain-containing protein [Marinomonas mediterranea]WCN15675.1 helix-turn-helix domain-containing protein [Marinomonas mediterranea MMB-1]
MNDSYGVILKNWRKQRRYSQLQLSLEAGISSRHLSFLETGRSLPSKDTVVKLGDFLKIPKREINRMLSVSGYAPIFRDNNSQNDNEGVDMTPILLALDTLLANHMPLPAFVLNRDWDVVKANPAAEHIMAELGFANTPNLIEGFLFDDPTDSRIVNWGETASVLLSRLTYEIDLTGGSNRLVELKQALANKLQREKLSQDINYNQAALSATFQLGDRQLTYFSLVTQMGSVLDITTSEFKVELMFPSNEETRQYHDRHLNSDHKCD